MSSITIYLFRVMFYIRRFKRCSQAICVQDPNVGMLKSDDDLFLDSSLQWPCNYVQVLVKFVSPSAPANTYSWSHGQVTCTGYACWATLVFILWLGLLAWSMILQYVIWQFTSNRIKGIMFTICLCYRGSNQPFWTDLKKNCSVQLIEMLLFVAKINNQWQNKKIITWQQQELHLIPYWLERE
jgi:hypothetical protein